MKKKYLLLGKIIISALLIFYIVNKVDIKQVLLSFKSINIFWLAIAFFVHILDYPISTFRWKLLLDAQGIRLPYRHLLGSYFVGAFFSTFLPTGIGGDVIRAYDSIRWSKTTIKPIMVIFVERLSGLFVLMTIAASILLFSGLEIKKSSYLIWICVVFFVLLAFMLLIFLWSPATRISKKIFNLPVLKIFKKSINEIYEAVSLFRYKAKYIGWVLLVATLLQFVVVLHYYLIGLSLGIPVPLIFYFLIIPIISLLLTLPISISGIGVRENVYVIFFGAYGVLNAPALALAWISFSFVIISGMIGAVIYLTRR